MTEELKYRFEVYQSALKVYESKKTKVGICYAINEVMGYTLYDIPVRFPEIWAQKPEYIESTGYWWPLDETEPRVNAFLAAIKLIKS